MPCQQEGRVGDIPVAAHRCKEGAGHGGENWVKSPINGAPTTAAQLAVLLPSTMCRRDARCALASHKRKNPTHSSTRRAPCDCLGTQLHMRCTDSDNPHVGWCQMNGSHSSAQRQPPSRVTPSAHTYWHAPTDAHCQTPPNPTRAQAPTLTHAYTPARTQTQCNPC